MAKPAATPAENRYWMKLVKIGQDIRAGLYVRQRKVEYYYAQLAKGDMPKYYKDLIAETPNFAAMAEA